MRTLILFVACLTCGVFAAPKTPFRRVPIPDGRIVGGWPVNIDQVPYQVSVEILGTHSCGGASITNTFIVSAAHCFDWPVSWYTVRAGSSIQNSGGVLALVANIVIHPNYDTITLDNDIGIVILAAPLPVGPFIGTIALPPPNQTLPDGTQATFICWGTQLTAVTIPIVDRARCNQLYSVVGWPINSNMLCGEGCACQNNSGGPLTVAKQLIGVKSWGIGCRSADFPEVFADVSYLRAFITDVTGL